jgi:NAD(P)-dependent dehydrogenase (short-subunit alcohol dehydrogenase family)
MSSMPSFPSQPTHSIVITGATSGIGLATARAFAQNGDFVLGVGRSPGLCSQAAKVIRDETPGAFVRYLVADLSSQAQVRRLAEEIRTELVEKELQCLHALINVAGVYSPGFIRTIDDVELTFAVSHLSAFLLTHELLPLLLAAPSGRVITVSSGSHHHTFLDLGYLERPFPYVGLWAYKVTKLANILFTVELNRRYANSNLKAFAIDPGLVNTAIAEKNNSWLTRWVWRSRRKHGVDPEIPARTILYTAGNEILKYSAEFYWYNSQPSQPSKVSMDPRNGQILWEKSNKMCGILNWREA